MKRILALTLVAAMLLGGCGKLIPGRGNAEAAKNDQAAEIGRASCRERV